VGGRLLSPTASGLTTVSTRGSLVVLRFFLRDRAARAPKNTTEAVRSDYRSRCSSRGLLPRPEEVERISREAGPIGLRKRVDIAFFFLKEVRRAFEDTR